MDMVALLTEFFQSEVPQPWPTFDIPTSAELRDALRTRIGDLEAKVSKMAEWIKGVHQNYDCDNDGHRYDTYCRKCEAKQLLQELGLWKET